MAFISAIFDWFKDPDNRGAVEALVGLGMIAAAWATGFLKWLVSLVRPKTNEPAPGPRQTASKGGVNIAGNARDVTTHAGKTDDPS